MRTGQRLGLAAALLASACFQDSSSTPSNPRPGSTGSDSGATTSSTSGSSTSLDPATTDLSTSSGSTGQSQECDDTEVCLSPAPPRWQGPFERVSRPGGAMPPQCEAPVATAAFVGSEVITGAPSQCPCDCQSLDVACGEYLLTIYSDDVCVSSSSVTLTESCQPLPSEVTQPSLWGPGTAQITGTCQNTSVPSMSEVVHEGRVALCSDVVTGAACDDGGACASATPEVGNAYCIAAAGDQPCPAGPFSERQLIFQEFDDDRGCSACQCDERPTGVCNDTLRAYGSSDLICSGASDSVTTCQMQTNSVRIAWDRTAIMPMCGVTDDSMPQGAVTPREPLTVCCVP